jgi:hypothetical protein
MCSGEEALKLMLVTHFLGSEVLNEEDISQVLIWSHGSRNQGLGTGQMGSVL